MDELRGYQLTDANILAKRRHAILAHDPGLGKTRTALYAAQLAGFHRVGVIAPAVVRSHWYNEAAVVAPSLDLHVESYQRLVINKPAQMAFGQRELLILDEEHFLKTRDSQRTKLILTSDIGLAHRFPRVWGVSGTPMPRHPGELYPMLFAFWRRELEQLGIRDYMTFLERYTWFKHTKHGPRVYSAKQVPELRALLSKVLIRRTVKEANLPPLRFGVLTLNAPDIRDALALQADVDPSILAMLENGELPRSDGSRFALAKLRHAIGDLKAHAVGDLLTQELDDDEHSTRVVFAFHHTVLDILARRLAPFGVIDFRGGMSPTQQRSAVEMFGKTRRVFLAQITAAAVGLDGLQYKAHEGLIVEPEWNSDFNVQAARRLVRLGQLSPVQIRMVALAGTIDEALVRGHYREAAMRREVVDAEE